MIVSLPSPTNLVVANHTATSITLTWNQPPNSVDAVDGYEINYNFSISECRDSSYSAPVTVIVEDGAVRNYTLTNSVSTPIEEDSRYLIQLTAINSITRSLPLKSNSL